MILDIIAASDIPASTGNVATDLYNKLHYQFGWNLPFFAAQCINFIIVAFVLKKFAFGPIGTMLAERAERIKAGEEKLKKIESDLKLSEKRTAEAIEQANEKAKEMIAEAQKSAANITEEKTQEAIQTAEKILSKAEQNAKNEREQMVRELKGDFGRLVATATAVVSEKVLTDADKAKINEQALASIEK